MPIIDHTRVTFSGHFGSPTVPQEIWAFNINFPPTAYPNVDTDAPTKAAALSQAWQTHMATSFGSDVILTRTRLADIDAGGLVQKTATGAYRQADDTTLRQGLYTSVSRDPMPLQTALCVSLTTGRAGPTGKGRFFLPWPKSLFLAPDYRLTDAQASGFASIAKGFVNALGTALGSPPVVVSSKGYTSVVTGLRVGRAPDTMRSRRSATLEGYAVLAL